MADPRFFLTEALPEGDSVIAPLSAHDLHHAADVLRLRAGESVVLVEPSGTAWAAEIVEIGSGILRVAPLELLASVWEPDVTLVLGVSKGSRFDEAVEGAVEVGVSAVWPVLTARSVVKLDDRKSSARAERWQRVAHAAAKQSQRRTVPTVLEPRSFGDTLEGLDYFDLVLVAWEEAHGTTIAQAIEAEGAGADERVAVVIGPEGGLTADEVERLEAIGAIPVTLGPTILRTETAGVVAPALAISELRSLRDRELR